MDEKPHTGHDQDHRRRERIDPQGKINVKRARGNPGVDGIDQGASRWELEKGRAGEQERQQHDPWGDEIHRLAAQPRPDEDVEQYAEQGKEHDETEVRDRLYGCLCVFHVYQRIRLSSSALTVSLPRKTDKIIAKPTAASAAATAMTKKTITCPSIEPS